MVGTGSINEGQYLMGDIERAVGNEVEIQYFIGNFDVSIEKYFL